MQTGISNFNIECKKKGFIGQCIQNCFGSKAKVELSLLSGNVFNK